MYIKRVDYDLRTISQSLPNTGCGAEIMAAHENTKEAVLVRGTGGRSGEGGHGRCDRRRHIGRHAKAAVQTMRPNASRSLRAGLRASGGGPTSLPNTALPEHRVASWPPVTGAELTIFISYVGAIEYDDKYWSPPSNFGLQRGTQTLDI